MTSMRPISVSGHAKPALKTWGAGGVLSPITGRGRYSGGGQVEGLVVLY
jgi:hypothetical protein